MRILFLTDKFAPERGGSQIIFANAYRHLPEHHVTVITRDCAGATEFDATYPHQVIRLPWGRVGKVRSLSFGLRLMAGARRLCAVESFDQIHCGQVVETAPVGVRLARRLKVPCVIHTFAEDVTTFDTHPVFGPMMRHGLAAATEVTTISRFTVQRLQRLGVPEERIHLLYPGLTPEEWGVRSTTEDIITRYGLAGKRVILTVSRLIPRKGQDQMLRALPTVLRQFPDTVYLIVGDGIERERLGRLASQLGVQDQVRFAGSISNQDTAAYYHASDVFAMPNREMRNGDIEGFGLVFLEANACGKPVIGGRSGGAVDAIVDGETGYLVDPNSPAEIAERLLALLGDPALATRMGEAGRKRVINGFTWNHCGRALHDVTMLAANRHTR